MSKQDSIMSSHVAAITEEDWISQLSSQEQKLLRNMTKRLVFENKRALIRLGSIDPAGKK